MSHPQHLLCCSHRLYTRSGRSHRDVTEVELLLSVTLQYKAMKAQGTGVFNNQANISVLVT